VADFAPDGLTIRTTTQERKPADSVTLRKRASKTMVSVAVGTPKVSGCLRVFFVSPEKGAADEGDEAHQRSNGGRVD